MLSKKNQYHATSLFPWCHWSLIGISKWDTVHPFSSRVYKTVVGQSWKTKRARTHTHSLHILFINTLRREYVEPGRAILSHLIAPGLRKSAAVLLRCLFFLKVPLFYWYHKVSSDGHCTYLKQVQVNCLRSSILLSFHMQSLFKKQWSFVMKKLDCSEINQSLLPWK